MLPIAVVVRVAEVEQQPHPLAAARDGELAEQRFAGEQVEARTSGEAHLFQVPQLEVGQARCHRCSVEEHSHPEQRHQLPGVVDRAHQRRVVAARVEAAEVGLAGDLVEGNRQALQRDEPVEHEARRQDVGAAVDGDEARRAPAHPHERHVRPPQLLRAAGVGLDQRTGARPVGGQAAVVARCHLAVHDPRLVVHAGDAPRLEHPAQRALADVFVVAVLHQPPRQARREKELVLRGEAQAQAADRAHLVLGVEAELLVVEELVARVAARLQPHAVVFQLAGEPIVRLQRHREG